MLRQRGYHFEKQNKTFSHGNNLNKGDEKFYTKTSKVSPYFFNKLSLFNPMQCNNIFAHQNECFVLYTGT